MKMKMKRFSLFAFVFGTDKCRTRASPELVSQPLWIEGVGGNVERIQMGSTFPVPKAFNERELTSEAFISMGCKVEQTKVDRYGCRYPKRSNQREGQMEQRLVSDSAQLKNLKGIREYGGMFQKEGVKD